MVDCQLERDHYLTATYITTSNEGNSPERCNEGKVWVLHKDLASHLKEKCVNRSYQCPHCGKEDAYYEITSSSHLEMCTKLSPNEPASSSKTSASTSESRKSNTVLIPAKPKRKYSTHENELQVRPESPYTSKEKVERLLIAERGSTKLTRRRL